MVSVCGRCCEGRRRGQSDEAVGQGVWTLPEAGEIREILTPEPAALPTHLGTSALQNKKLMNLCCSKPQPW